MRAWFNPFQCLEIGDRRPLLVRRESIPNVGLCRRILFASDLHLRKDGPRHVVDSLLNVVSDERPDIILLGGDLIDWSSGLLPLRHLIEDMSAVAPVAAVSGNHDRWIGLADVREAVLRGGGQWLEDHPLRWDASIAVYGAPDQERLSADCQILCTHHPGPTVTSGDFDLVLSGHLHGGQFVFFERGGRLYPGAFAYRWNGLRFQENGSTLLVSRGVRDTLPLRWNCPREVILVSL